MKALLFSRYERKGASSRLRSLQHINGLAEEGIEVDVSPLLGDDYLKKSYSEKNISWTAVLRRYLSRLRSIVSASKYDVLWIEKELYPWLPAAAERMISSLGIPYLVDYDDAVFHYYDQHSNPVVKALLGRKIDTVMKMAEIVTVGNKYLENRARIAGADDIRYRPTAIDFNRYKPGDCGGRSEFRIGWIGTPYTAKYLDQIASALRETDQKFPFKLVLIGAGNRSIKGVTTEHREWSEETEVGDVQSIDVGIMPLPNRPFERGKCGYKLLQYMACGKPVIASDVGVNGRIAEGCGFTVSSKEGWVKALVTLYKDPELRAELGQRARDKVEDKYGLNRWTPKLAAALKDAA